MKIQIKIGLLIISLLIVTSIFWIVFVKSDRPRNIILFIGDGMGVSQITACKIVKGNLNLERCKALGLLTTHSQNSLITDSAAAGTAMATGHKTLNHAVSVSKDKKSLKTVLEYAEERQKSTGLVVACSITNATPAVFVAHVDSRKKKDVIAEQIVKSGIDVFFGGGLCYFLPRSTKGSERSDEKNLIIELEKRMKVVRSVKEFQNLGDVDSVAGFFALKHPPMVRERRPRLSELTRKAIEILSKNKKGFFLMVEGSLIDSGGHRNDQNCLISEMIDFDDTVGVGLDFAEQNKQTLVVVTSDHETGGFAIHNGSMKYKTITESRFTGNKHTAAMVPLFAYGPGSAAFSGIGDNTIVGRTLIEFLKETH